MCGDLMAVKKVYKVTDEILKDEQYNPSLKIQEEESIDERLNKSKKLLAPLEYEVLKLKIYGYSNRVC